MNKEIEISPRQIAEAIQDLLDENEQLRTIIFELEKWLKKEMAYKDVEKKLQELKGDNNE